MKRWVWTFTVVLLFIAWLGIESFAQVRVLAGPGAVSLADDSFASVDWRFALEWQFYRALGARAWFRIDGDFGPGFGLGPLLRLGQASFNLGLQWIAEIFFLVLGAGLDFGLGRAGPVQFRFFNDFEFALAFSEELPSLFQYHAGVSIGF
jgi:hypothetical protein